MISNARTPAPWKLRTRSLELGRRTLIMGVINITPDSFSDGASFLSPEAAITRCFECLDEGADLIDLGAESTRPGSQAGSARDAKVSAEEELERLLPVLEALRKERPAAVVSVDTYKSETAQAVLAAGAEIINDVSGFSWDDAMPAVCATSGCGVVLTHTRGRPDQWRTQENLPASELMNLIRDGLFQSLETAHRSSIASESIVLDPGYGFGKRLDQNYAILARQSELLALGRPLLAGLSRKSFLGHTLAELHGGKQAPIEARENATIAASVAAILLGASIVRVHNVRPAIEAARIADAILAHR